VHRTPDTAPRVDPQDLRIYSLEVLGVDIGERLAVAIAAQSSDADQALDTTWRVVRRARLLKAEPSADDTSRIDAELERRIGAGHEARRCARFLHVQLRHGPVPHRTLAELWQADGGSTRTLYRIRRALGLVEDHARRVHWPEPEADAAARCTCVTVNGDARPLRLQRVDRAWTCARCGKVAAP